MPLGASCIQKLGPQFVVLFEEAMEPLVDAALKRKYITEDGFWGFMASFCAFFLCFLGAVEMYLWASCSCHYRFFLWNHKPKLTLSSISCFSLVTKPASVLGEIKSSNVFIKTVSSFTIQFIFLNINLC